MKRREYNVSEGKKRLLEASLKEFAERGFEGARVSQIAANAEVNKALIYYHFKNKEGLYISTINDLFSEAMPVALDMSGLSIQEKMFGVIEQFIRFLDENPYFVQIMDHSVHQSGDIFQKVYEQNIFFEAVLALYEEGLKKGECRQVEHIVDCVVSLLGASYFYFSHRHAVRRFYGDMEEADIVEIHVSTLKEIVTRVLFN